MDEAWQAIFNFSILRLVDSLAETDGFLDL